MKTLLAIAAATSLLVGCATSSEWEYKVAAPEGDEALLIKLVQEGWILIEHEEGSWYYFKRAKR